MTAYRPANVNILTEVSTYSLSASKTFITGVVKWEVNHFSFPDPIWNDFVLLIASCWMEGLIQLRCNGKPVIFRFMDGPFYVECVNQNGKVIGEFVDDRKSKKVDLRWVTSLSQLERTLKHFAMSVLQYCDNHDVTGPDIDNLRLNLAAVESVYR